MVIGSSKNESDGGTLKSSMTRNMPLALMTVMVSGVGFATYAYGGSVPTPQSGSQVAKAPDAKTQTPGSKPAAGTPAAPEAPADAPVKKKAVLLSAVTFPGDEGTTYVLGRDLAARLSVPIELSPDEKTVKLENKPITQFRRTYNGDILLPLRNVSLFNGTWNEDPTTRVITVSVPTGEFQVEVGKKRIEVDKALQELKAYQGDVVVVQTNISTGRPGHNTPNGNFLTGPKERMHYSHKYNDAEMPWAIQVNGDVFLHGYTSVPPYPASHGCVRIPLNNENPAKYLFHWVERGTETKIFGVYDWNKRTTTHRRKKKKFKSAAAAPKASPIAPPVAKPPK